MSVTGFERIQICCEDVFSAAKDYARLLGVAPQWSGKYRLCDSSERLLDQGNSAWFNLENTRIELFDSSATEPRMGIVGLMMGTDSSELESFQQAVCTYSDAENSCSEIRYLCEAQAHEGFSVALVNNQPHDNLAGDIGDIPRVDHLVLRSNDAEACIRRFGEPGLGIRLALDQTVPEWGGRMLFFRGGKLTLEVIVPNDGIEGQDYFWGIAYQADDIDHSHQRLIDNDIEASAVRDGRKPGTRVATVKSCDLGVPTLLVQPAQRK